MSRRRADATAAGSLAVGGSSASGASRGSADADDSPGRATADEGHTQHQDEGVVLLVRPPTMDTPSPSLGEVAEVVGERPRR